MKQPYAKLEYKFATIHLYDDKVVICSQVDHNGKPKTICVENANHTVLTISKA